MDKSIIKCGTYTLELFTNSSSIGKELDLSSEYVRELIVKKSDKAFSKCLDEFNRGYGSILPSKQGTITVMLDCYYPEDYNGPVSRAKNIFYTICNSNRQDDLYYNGYLNLLGALADCDMTKDRFMHVSTFIYYSEWCIYYGNRPANIGNCNIIPEDCDSKNKYSHIMNKDDDTNFLFLKNTEEAYQSSDFIVKVKDQEERKLAVSEFRELMTDARTYLNIPKDRFIIGVLTTYTDEFVEYAKKYNEEDDLYEMALDIVVYMMNYQSQFDKRHLDSLIYKLLMRPMEDQPENLLYILSIDIISATTAVFTLNGDIIAAISIPDNWYPKLLAANGIGVSEEDE